MHSKERYVAIFTSACCTGWAYIFDATEAELEELKPLAKEYCSLDRWRARNCDGGVGLSKLDAFIDKHNDNVSIGDPLDYPDFIVSNENELLEYYNDDGEGHKSTLEEVKELLMEKKTLA